MTAPASSRKHLLHLEGIHASMHTHARTHPLGAYTAPVSQQILSQRTHAHAHAQEEKNTNTHTQRHGKAHTWPATSLTPSLFSPHSLCTNSTSHQQWPKCKIDTPSAVSGQPVSADGMLTNQCQAIILHALQARSHCNGEAGILQVLRACSYCQCEAMTFHKLELAPSI